MVRRRWIILAVAAVLLITGGTAAAAPSRGSGGPLADSTDLSFTDSQRITSRYHLYAAGLNWSRPVGMIIYADGTGEYGLKNPRSSYLLSGSNGLVNVAKRLNMVLVTPIAPGDGCSCWHSTSSGYTPKMKARWSYELVRHVQSKYPIELNRVGFGGYSSGAQWATRYFGPAHAPQIMTDGVAVAISYGGQPAERTTFQSSFSSNVVFVSNVGSRDPALNAPAGVMAGYNWYSRNGFATELNVVPGVGHSRSGQFGSIMEAELRQHVRAG